MSLSPSTTSTTTSEQMTQIVPVPTWLDHVKLSIDKIAMTGNPGYKYSATHRCMGKAICMPLCCLPCFTWSTVWRIFCCPISCVRGHGPLSNNGCTDLTDACIAKFYNEMDGKNTLDISSNTTVPESDMYQAVEYAIFKIKTAEETRTRYAIADFMFPVYKKLREAKGVMLVGISCTPMDLEMLKIH